MTMTADAGPGRRLVPAWVRANAGSGSVVLLDPDEQPAAAIADRLRSLGVHVRPCQDPVHAAAILGSEGIAVVVVNAAIGAEAMRRFVEIVHGKLDVTVLLAYSPCQITDIGPAVLAGARPLLALPYDPASFVAALKQSATPAPPPPVITVAGLVLDRAGYSASIDDHRIGLSALEFELLFEFASHPDTVISRERFARRFWPDSPDPDGTIMAAVKRLRRKLDAHGIGHAISTVRGVGYLLVSSTLRTPATN